MRQTVTIISRAVHLQSTQVTTRRQAFRRPISTKTRESAMVLAPAKQSSIWVSMKSFQLPSEYENMATKAAKLKLTGKRLQLLGELRLWEPPSRGSSDMGVAPRSGGEPYARAPAQAPERSGETWGKCPEKARSRSGHALVASWSCTGSFDDH